MKTVLLHIHDDDGLESRLQAALDLVRAQDGHLSCVQVTPFEFIGGTFGGDPFGGNPLFASLLDMMRTRERETRHDLEARLRHSAVRWDWQCFDGSVVKTLIDHAKLADTIVISQFSPKRSNAMRPLPIVADMAIHAHTPVLVVPPGKGGLPVGGDALVAWNGSVEAAHALRQCVPLLQRARAVHLVTVADNPEEQPVPGAASYLELYGIHADIHQWPAKGRNATHALRDAAGELGAGYMVMGAYGHARWRETVLGGVTHDMIRDSDIPLMLVH